MPARVTLSIVLLDCDFRIASATHIEPPLTARQVIGRPPWDESFCPRRDQHAWKRACAETMKRGKFVIDLKTPQIGTWRNWLWRCNAEGISICSIARKMPQGLCCLTAKDWQLLKCILQGRTTKQIAHEWRVSENAVSNRRSRVARKLKTRPHELPIFCGQHWAWLEK